MSDEQGSALRNRIRSEMLAEHQDALARNFELAKSLLRITASGKVEVLANEKFGGKQRVLLYLIGKVYAKEAELADSEFVTNKEFSEQLGIPENSLRPWLSELRDDVLVVHRRDGATVRHAISMSRIGTVLKAIAADAP
jgi:hypothetical protein